MFEAFAQADGTTARAVRRNRARAVDQPRPRRPARRGDHADERARRGQHVHRLPPAGAHAAALRRPALPSAAEPRPVNGVGTTVAHRPRQPTVTPTPLGDAAERVSYDGRCAPGSDRADRRRRLPQHLRADSPARARKAQGRRGRERRRGARRCSSSGRHRHRADGHHDAGDERLRDDGGHPAASRARRAADHRRHRQGGRRRARALHRRRRVGLHPQAGRHGGAAGRAEPVVPGLADLDLARAGAGDGRTATGLERPEYDSAAAILVVDDNPPSAWRSARSWSRSATRSSRPSRARTRCARCWPSRSR